MKGSNAINIEKILSSFFMGGPLAGSIDIMYTILRSLGLEPGKDMKTAVEEAQRLNAKLILGDIPVEQTIAGLKRVPITKLFTIMSDPTLVAHLKSLNIGLSNIDDLLDRKIVREMRKLQKFIPELYETLIQNRDEFMFNQLRTCGGNRIVAVVGMGHMDGIEQLWFEHNKLISSPNSIKNSFMLLDKPYN